MIETMIDKSDVGDVLRRALSGERLSVEDGVRLFESDDIGAIGAVANEIRHRINGNITHYVVNRHINYSDICKNRCRFCAYSRNEGDADAYAMTVDDVLARAESEWQRIKFTELHIVGGLHPTLPLDYYTEMLSVLKSRFPTVHIQAFTAVEIAHIAEIAGLSISDTLAMLRDAGLGSLPGGGAEIFSPRTRTLICPEKMPGSQWLDVMRQAHTLGIKSNATMLYGHVETYQERVEHMIALRDLQDETGLHDVDVSGHPCPEKNGHGVSGQGCPEKNGHGVSGQGCPETTGFMTFIPLKFHSANTELGEFAAPLSSIDDLKVYAVARLMLDNIPHIKAFWIMLGLKLAQVALSFGADDFDGTVVEEKITHRAGASTPEGMTVADITRLIEETGTVAVERDTIYNRIVRDEAGSFAPASAE